MGAEDNWRNDYPDELDGDDSDDDAYGFEDYHEKFEDEISGLDSLQIRDEEYSGNSDEGDDEGLVYALDEDKEYSDVSNRHGSSYASYKRKMQRFLGDIDDQDDDYLDNDSSDDCSNDGF